MKKQDIAQNCDANVEVERLPYHAPQVKVHGKMERLTLQGGSLGGSSGGSGGVGGGTGDEG